MFLIEYRTGHFIDAERIDWIKIEKDKIEFTASCDPESVYVVEAEFKPTFVNNIQALNANHNVENYYNNLHKD